MSNVEELIASLEDRPDSPELVEELERELALAESWDQYATALPLFVRNLSDAVQRARFLIRAAHVCRHYAGFPEIADDLLLEIAEVSMTPEDTVEAVRLAFEPQEDWNGLVAACMDLSELASDDNQRSALIYAVGRTYEDRLYDPERAIHCYQRAFKLNPSITEPLHRARQIYAHADQWSTVEKLYGIELRVVSEGKPRARLLKELGYIQMERLGKRDAAIASFDEAVTLDPDMSGLQDVVDNLRAGSGAHGVVIASQLTGDSGHGVDVPEGTRVRSESSAHAAVTTEAPVGLTEEMRVSEVVSFEDDDMSNAPVDTQKAPPPIGFAPELGTQDIVVQPEQVSGSVVELRAVTASASELVVEEEADSPPPAPGMDSGVLDAVLEAEESAEFAAIDEAESAGNDAIVEAEGAEGPHAESPVDAAEVADEDGDDSQESEEVVVSESEETSEEDASEEDEVAADPATEHDADEDSDLAAAVLAAADEETDAEQPEAEVAPIAPVVASTRPPRRSASGGVPAVTLNASRESLGASLNAEEYIDVLRERARSGDTDGAMSLAFALELALRGDEPEGSLAEWVAEGLLDFEDTAAAVSALLPAALGQTAFWEALVECLDGLDEDERLGGAQYAARFYALQRFDEASAYSALAGALGSRDASVMDVAQKGNWRKVQQGLQTELADLGEEAEAEAYRAQSLIALGLGKVDKSADSIRRVLRGNKKDTRALWMHRALNRNLERWNPVADALKGLAPQVDEAGQRILYRELVDVYRDHLNQPMAVMQSLQKLSDADPYNVEVLDELAEMLEQVNNHRELVGVLRRKAEVVEDVDEKIAIYELVATTFIERFNNQAEALTAYEEVLALDPDNANALAQLEELYERRREWAKLIDIKQRRVERLDDPAARTAVLASAAEIAATRLRDNEQAEALWNAVVEEDESNEAALEALERLHERAKNWEKLADVLRRRVGTITDDEQRAQTLIKLGQIQSDRLDDAAGSVSTWEQLLEVDPENFRAREALKKSYVELEQWDELEAFYARDGAWADYVRQIEGIAGSHDDSQVAIDLLFRAADAWEERLNDELRSTKALEKVLSIDGENTAAARRLVPVYREKEDARRLPGALQIVLMHEQDEDARFDAIVELARLAAGPGRAPGEAVEWFTQALDTRPDAVSLLDEFEAVAADASAWSEVRGAYEGSRARLDSDTQADAWLDISLRLGHLLDERADDVDSALRCFDDVLEVDPGNLAALDARDRIYTRLGDWDSLLEALQAKLVSTDTPDARVALLERICLIQEEHREDVEAAISGYNEVLALAPAHESSLLALHRLYAQTGEAHALAEVLRTLIELRQEAPVERRALQVELAETCARQLSEFDEAMTLLRTVVSEAPEDARARALLEELLTDDSERVRAARLLEPLYQSEESWAKLVEILEIQVEASTDDEAATSMLSRIGRVHAEKLHDPRASSDAYARLLQRDPHSTEAREHLEALAGVTGEWTSLLELYESALDMLNPGLERDRTLAIELGTRGAVYHEEKAGDVDEAVRMHRRVLDFAPSRPETLADLAALFTRAERWEELLDVLDEQMQAATDDNTRRGLLMQSAEIRRFRMDDPAAAIDEYRRVLDIEPDNHEALDALDALYAETNDSASRAEVLERRVNQAEAHSEAQLELKNRLAAVYEDELGEVPRAMELWRDVLAEDSGNQRAFEGLEAQLETTDFAMAASEILEPLYTEQAAPDRLVRLLETRLLHVHAPEARRALYERIATLHESELSDRPSAIGSLMLAAEEFLGDAPLMERLGALVAVEGSWTSYADRLEELASEAIDPVARRSTMVRVARVRETELNDAGGAATLWRQVLDEAPNDSDALDALERLDAVLEEWPELIDVLLRKAEQPDAAAQAEVFKPLMFRAARLHEEALEQQDEAIEVLRSVLARDPEDGHSIEELERLFSATGRWEDLVENYDRKLRLTEDTDAKRELLFALGSVLEREIDDPDRAIDAYRRALDVAPSDLEALRALDRLLLATENWDGLLQVLEKQTALVEVPEQLLNIRSRMARLLETELFRVPDAIALYRGILDEEPSHVPSRQALASLIDRGEEAPQAAAILEPIYRAEGAWVELVEINKTRIEHAATIEARRDLYIDSAEIHEHRLVDVDAALDSYFAATQESLRVAELDHIERLSDIDGDWSRVIDLYTDLWDDQADPALRRVLGLRTAGLQESQVGDAQAAIDTHARLLEEDPSTQESLNALDRLYSAAGSAELLADVLQRRAQIGGTENDPAEMRLRLGALHADALGDPAEAVMVYRQVLDENPTNMAAQGALEGLFGQGVEQLDIAEILEPLYRSQSAWPKLVSLYETRVAHEDSPDERYRLLLSAADVQISELSDRPAAMILMGAALIERPNDLPLVERIEGVAAEADEWQLAAALFEQAQTDDLGDTEQLEFSVRRARILQDRLGDEAGAEKAWRNALEFEPGSESALRALDGITGRAERWEDNVEMVGRLREVVYDPTEQSALAFRQAATYRDRLGNLDAARDTFHEVLELDPTHSQAQSALISLYTDAERWSDLFDVYEQVQSTSSDAQQRLETTRLMARLAAGPLQRPEDGIELWLTVRMERQEDIEALDALISLYGQTDQPMDLADVIDKRVELETDDATKVELLHRSGDLWSNQLDNPDMAIQRLLKVRELAPSEPRALESLRGLYERVADFAALANVLTEMLAAGLIPEAEEAAVYEQLGSIYTDTLGQPARAIEAWKAVRARRPNDIESLERLEQLYQQGEQWAPLVEVLEARAANSDDEADTLNYLKRCGGLWRDQLQDPHKASEAFERVLDLDLGDTDAAVALEALYRQTESWESLAGLHLDRLEVMEEPWERLEGLRRASALYEQQLGRADGAFLIMGKALTEAPLDEEVRAELERLAASSEKEEDLVQIYRDVISNVASDPEHGEESTLPLLLAVGRLQDEGLDTPDMAEVYYDKALTLDPENETALTALESIYQRTEDHESLVGVLKRRAGLTFDVAEQVGFYRRAGALLEEKLQNIPESIEAYKMALRIDETDAESLAALERIYAENGQWRELIDVLERKAETTYDQSVLVGYRFRIAEVWRDQLSEDERAVDAFHEVLSLAPDHGPSLDALESLYAELGDWDRFLEVLDNKLMLTQEPESRIRVFTAQALVHETQFDDIDRAVDCLNQVLELQPHRLETIESLERIFTDQERLPELIDTLERHVEAVHPTPDKCAVLMRIAEAQVDQLDDAPAAIATYRRVLELDSEHTESLTRLGALYENEEQFADAVEMYERLAAVVAEPGPQTRLLYRVGRLFNEHLQNPTGAEQRWQQSLRIEESFLPAMEALEALYADQERWDEVVSMQQAQIDFTSGLPDRAPVMVRMAAIHRDALDDSQRARELFEEAVALDDRHIPAATSLIDMAYGEQDWVRCKPLLELVLGDASREYSDEERTHQWTRQGVVLENLGFLDPATDAFEQALRHEPQHLEAQLGAARGHARRGDREEAYALTVEILEVHASRLTPEQSVACCYQAGVLKSELGDAASARRMFESALEIDNRHEPSLRAVLTIVEAQGDKAALVDAKRRLLDITPDRQERLTLLIDIGDSYKDLGNLEEAESVYRQAVELDASSKIVLDRLLKVFMQTGNFRRATEVLGQLARLEEDPERLAKLCFTIAAIFRDELGEKDDAINFFNQALDAKVGYLEAFEAIDHLLTASRDWDALQRNYRRMIERVMQSGSDEFAELHVMLLKHLGEIYRSRLQRPEDAIAAYEAAAQLNPNDDILLTILTELLERSGAEPERLVVQHRRLLKTTPFRIDSYRALFKSYARAGEEDKAWCMASALCLLQKATPEEEEFYKQRLRGAPAPLSGTLRPEHWQRLRRTELDTALASIFETIATNLRADFSLDLRKNWNVNKRSDKLSPELALVRAVQQVSEQTTLGPIAVYKKPEWSGLSNANVDPMAIVAGNDMLSGKSPRELLFQVGRTVALMRPEAYLASAFPDTHFLKTFFFAAYAFVTQQIGDPTNEEAIKRYAYEIQDIPEIEQGKIRQAIDEMSRAERNPDLSAWLRDMDMFASRVGLLFCGDARAAVACIKDDKQKIGKASRKEKVGDLILFSISDEYFELRRAFGVAHGDK